MRRIVAAGGTDVGRVRDGNEDAYLVADSVFAVADGMGGHLAGEIASAKALEPVEALDGKVYADASRRSPPCVTPWSRPTRPSPSSPTTSRSTAAWAPPSRP
jgi:hypothetical protein